MTPQEQNDHVNKLLVLYDTSLTDIVKLIIEQQQTIFKLIDGKVSDDMKEVARIKALFPQPGDPEKKRKIDELNV